MITVTVAMCTQLKIEMITRWIIYFPPPPPAPLCSLITRELLFLLRLGVGGGGMGKGVNSVKINTGNISPIVYGSMRVLNSRWRPVVYEVFEYVRRYCR